MDMQGIKLMSDRKQMLVFWSKSAVEKAGENISALQAKLIEEATDITSGASDWFLHALPSEGDNLCYECRGHELPDKWKIFVQVAVYKPMAPIRDDHPDPERRGKVINFPEVIDSADNQVFALYDDLVAL